MTTTTTVKFYELEKMVREDALERFYADGPELDVSDTAHEIADNIIAANVYEYLYAIATKELQELIDLFDTDDLCVETIGDTNGALSMEQHVIKRVKQGDLELTVWYDPDPMNPREWDSLGTMLCSHGIYNFGDKQVPLDTTYRSWQEVLESEVFAPNGGKENVFYLPLYLYDHSGLSIATTPYSCRWDSGQVGWIWARKADLAEAIGVAHTSLAARAESIFRNEVEDYSKYLNGEVYGYTITRATRCECCSQPTTEVLESLGGFYQLEDMRESAPVEYCDLFNTIRSNGFAK